MPARLTALALTAAALVTPECDAARGIRAAWRDCSLCASPNAGWPMGAMAGLLGVRLEKEGHYALGDATRPLGPRSIYTGHRIAQLAGGLVTLAAVATCTYLHCGSSDPGSSDTGLSSTETGLSCVPDAAKPCYNAACIHARHDRDCDGCIDRLELEDLADDVRAWGSHLLPPRGRSRPARVCARIVTERLDEVEAHRGVDETWSPACLSAEHIADFAACHIEGLRL